MITIIINPVAGRRARPVGERVDLARRIAAERGEAADVLVTEQPAHARALTRAARAAGARLIVAWGGDGTVSEVATELAFSPVPFAIVPSGSGNGLARELRISADPARALTTALSAAPRPMDLGEIDGHLFVNVAGIGLDAHVAARFNESGNRRRGLAGYAALTARALATYRPARYAIATPDGRIEARAVLVTIANSAQFGNGARIAPGARIDDGLLDLVVVEERSRLGTLCRMPWLFTGTIDRLQNCTAGRITEATITTGAPMTFHVDGEPLQGGTSLHVRVHPGAVQIAVPSISQLPLGVSHHEVTKDTKSTKSILYKTVFVTSVFFVSL